VLPLISIDEYHSKIDDNKCIVIVLFSPQKEPAKDLSRFIEKSNLPILDTEVSPAPNPHGFYLVFVEVLRNNQFITTLLELIEQINNLTNVNEWNFRGYHMPDHETHPISKDELDKYINLDPKAVDLQYTKGKTNEAIGRFFSDSLIESVEIKDNILNLNSRFNQTAYKIFDFGAAERINAVFESKAITFDLSSESKILEQLLGPQYEVDSIDDKFVIVHNNQTLVIKPI
jgi:hypothetical protein